MRKSEIEPLESEPKKYFILHLTDVRQSEKINSAMAKTITIRPNAQDRDIIDRLAVKLGIKTSQVIKVALRKLAQSENLRLRAS